MLGELLHSVGDPVAHDEFFRGLTAERAWFRRHPHATRYTRPLTHQESVKLGFPYGGDLVGRRLSTGNIVWIVYSVTRPQDRHPSHVESPNHV